MTPNPSTATAPPSRAAGIAKKQVDLDAQNTARALRGWLGSGPIDSPEGAICAWVEEASGRAAFEYPEITGYALTYLMGHSDLSGAELERAGRAADWLQERLDFGDLSARDGWDDGAAYSFDLGMIAAGLILFGRRCESDAHTAAGVSLAAKLRDAATSSAGLTSILEGSPPSSRTGWSTEGKPHLLKVVQSLLLADEAGLDGSKDAAARLVEEVSAMQLTDGSFPTQPGDDKVMLHPHNYTLEGLWMWSQATGDTAAGDRARKGTEWAWEQQLASGGFPRAARAGDPADSAEQGDVTSQTVRMAAALGLQPDGFDRAVERLLQFARPVPGGAALIYQPEAQARHHNAWVTMFGAQAMEWATRGPGAWSTLV